MKLWHRTIDCWLKVLLNGLFKELFELLLLLVFSPQQPSNFHPPIPKQLNLLVNLNHNSHCLFQRIPLFIPCYPWQDTNNPLMTLFPCSFLCLTNYEATESILRLVYVLSQPCPSLKKKNPYKGILTSLIDSFGSTNSLKPIVSTQFRK